MRLLRLLITTMVLGQFLVSPTESLAEQQGFNSPEFLREQTAILLSSFVQESSTSTLPLLRKEGPRPGSNQKEGESFIWTQMDLQEKTRHYDEKGRLWKKDEQLFAASEPDSSGKHYFVQGYFNKVLPKQGSPLSIWQTVQREIRLVPQKEGSNRQSSAETYTRKAGTIADVTTLLADWIAMTGVDARVVEGKKDGDLHSWVLVRDGEEEFLLDVSIDALERISMPRMTKRYQPIRSFNARYLWTFNDGQFELASRFLAESNAIKASAESRVDVRYRVTSDTPIMLSPDNQARNLGFLKRGERIQLLKSDGEWHHVVYRGEHKGYIPVGSTQRVM